MSGRPVSCVDRIDGFQRRHRVIGFPLAVIYKYIDDQGNTLAALMTFYAFLSVFPILLLSSSILGFVLQDNPELQQRILNSTLQQFPVIGDQLKSPAGLTGSRTAIIIGILGALYGASRVAAFTQNAMNTAWLVPRNARPNPLTLRLRGLLLITTAGVAVIAVSAVSALSDNLPVIGIYLRGNMKVLVTIAVIILDTIVFVALFKMSTAHKHSLRAALPGALVTAIGWHFLQIVGTEYVAAVIAQSSITSGVFVIVIGMFAWMYAGAIFVVIGVETNVVIAHRLWPRALLTPVTDMVDLTEADKRAYTHYATMHRTKDFTHITVEFQHDGQHKTFIRTQREARLKAADEQDAQSPQDQAPPP